MRKKILFIFILCLMMLCTVIFAADQGYKFKLSYEGQIIAGEEKSATVTLTGTEATPYTNVQVKSEHISGPAKAQVFAYDANGNKFDLSETGEWGPTSGFAVGGTFTNETPITVIYPQAGTYVSRLSLVDLSNNNQVITSKEFTVTVVDDEADAPANNVIINTPANTVANNTIEKIPQAGISWWVYIIVIAAVIVAMWALITFVKNKND